MRLMQAALSALVTVFIFYSHAVAQEVEIGDETDKVSYSVGHQVGADFKRQGVELNEEVMLQGIKDGLSGTDDLLMSPEEMKVTLIALKKRIETSAQEAQRDQIAADLAEGKAFLATNAKKEGVEVLENGLQYQIIKAGKGERPKASDTVEAYHKTTLIDGTAIGNSAQGDTPQTFQVANTIAGLKQALQLMPEGSRWKIFVPAHLAFGEEPTSPMAGKTLVFDVELVNIKEAAGKTEQP